MQLDALTRTDQGVGVDDKITRVSGGHGWRGVGGERQDSRRSAGRLQVLSPDDKGRGQGSSFVRTTFPPVQIKRQRRSVSPSAPTFCPPRVFIPRHHGTKPRGSGIKSSQNHRCFKFQKIKRKVYIHFFSPFLETKGKRTPRQASKGFGDFPTTSKIGFGEREEGIFEEG